jgi:hypothetical protein
MSNFYYRLAFTESGLGKGYLFSRGLPPPSTVTFKDFSGEYSQSDGGKVQHGYLSVVLMWNVLTYTQSYQLRKYTNSSVLYATIDRNNGTKPGRDWVDVRGVPLPMNIERDRGIAGSIGGATINVTLTINNLTIVNDPSSVIT